MPHRAYDVFLEASKAPLGRLTLAPSQLAKGVLKASRSIRRPESVDVATTCLMASASL